MPTSTKRSKNRSLQPSPKTKAVAKQLKKAQKPETLLKIEESET